MKKNLIKIFLILIVIFLIIALVLINKNKEEKENNTDTVLEISTETEDEEYTLRDSETNSVITTVQDEGLLQQYIDNPDYNPYPSGQSPEIE